MKSVLWGLFCLFAPLSMAQAQAVRSATIVYDVEIESDEIDAMQAAMMANSTLTLTYKGKLSRIEMNMGPMNTTVITNAQTNQGLMLMNMMGQKLYKRLTDQELAAANEQQSAAYKVSYTGETAEIAGYEVKQAIVTTPEGETLEMWVTEEILSEPGSNGFTYQGLKGFPLEMDMEQNGLLLHLVAREVDTTTPDDGLFSLTPPAGYGAMDE